MPEIKDILVAILGWGTMTLGFRGRATVNARQLRSYDKNSLQPNAYRRKNALQKYDVDMTKIVTYYRAMISLNINEIKAHFSSCLSKVSSGETVIVCKRNVPIAEIKPIAAPPTKKRPIGLAGKEYPDFEIDDAFFEPLPDDIVAAFNGEDAS